MNIKTSNKKNKKTRPVILQKLFATKTKYDTVLIVTYIVSQIHSITMYNIYLHTIINFNNS